MFVQILILQIFLGIFVLTVSCNTSIDRKKQIREISLNDIKLNTKNPDNLLVTWPNGTSIKLNLTAVKTPQTGSVDCLGLGSTIAKFLDWWFKQTDQHLHTLNVKFYLSSRKKPKRVVVVNGPQFGLDWTDFVAEKKTFIIVHGFLSVGNEMWIKDMEEALLMMDDVNVVVVDWAAIGNTFNYYKAAVNTKTVGNEIARFLLNIVNSTINNSKLHEPRFGKLHLIGHSLGAHICGIAALEFKKKQSYWAVDRITGLDPAQPCFKNISWSLQLDKNDAPFVDVIHTNAKLLSSLGLGLPHPIGHIDFYPNGGKRQPGCTQIKKSYTDYLPLPNAMVNQAICSHGRSYIYFTESIIAATRNNCTFWSHHWDQSYRRAAQLISEGCGPDKCTEMGIRAEKYPHRGIFFAMTSSTPPFCDTDIHDQEKIARELREDFDNEVGLIASKN